MGNHLHNDLTQVIKLEDFHIGLVTVNPEKYGLNLKTAVGDGKLTQSFDPESLKAKDPFTNRECESLALNENWFTPIEETKMEIRSISSWLRSFPSEHRHPDRYLPPKQQYHF